MLFFCFYFLIILFMNKIIIKYQLNNRENREDYQQLYDAIENWYIHIKMMNSTYCIKTYENPKEVLEYLDNFIDNNDYMLCDYVSNSAYGRLPQYVWDRFSIN